MAPIYARHHAPCSTSKVNRWGLCLLPSTAKKHPPVHTAKHDWGCRPFWMLAEEAAQLGKSKCWQCFWHSSITTIQRLSHPYYPIYFQNYLIFQAVTLLWGVKLMTFLWKILQWFCEGHVDTVNTVFSFSERIISILTSRLKCLPIFPYAKSFWFYLSSVPNIALIQKEKEKLQLEPEKENLT